MVSNERETGLLATDRAVLRRMSWRFLLASTALVGTLATASVASANGRFPEANQLFISPADANQIQVRVTFGLLVSRDGGKTWNWVCEQAIGIAGIEDPMYAFTPTSAIVGTTFQGVVVSRDQACSWPKVGGALEKGVFIDLTQRPSERQRIIVFDSSYDRQDGDGGIFFRSQLYETVDDATTFTPLGAQLDPALLGYTVDVAPSDADRLYVSATRNPGTTPSGVLLVSRDRAKTWEEREIKLEGTERSPWIAAVGKTNPDRIYVRTYNATDKPGRLLLSDDAGKTFRTIFTSQGALAGFALSPDETKVYVGGPRDGLQIANTTDFAFRKTSDVQVQCITAAEDGLWVCSNEMSGFIAARTRDEGATFDGKVHWLDIAGPLPCPPSPESDQCKAAWPALRASLGFGSDAGPDAGSVPTGTSPNDSGCAIHSGSMGAWASGLLAFSGVLALVRRRVRTPPSCRRRTERDRR